MEQDRHLDVVAAQARALATAIATEPKAGVARYPTWSLADLGRHVGAIHRWVAALVAARATTRLPQPDVAGVADHDVAAWLVTGSDDVVAALASLPPDAPIWTFSRNHDTVAFWRRRMAVETTLHRWDAQDTLGEPDPVADWLAVDAIDEALAIYCLPGLDGTAVGGSGQRLEVAAGSATWRIRLGPDGVVVESWATDGQAGAPDDAPASAPTAATIHGSPLDTWLLLGARRDLDALVVDGDRWVAQRFVDLVHAIPGPA